MFGGIERGSGLGFVKLVESRNAGTFLPIIQEFIRPGSIIYFDLLEGVWRNWGTTSGLSTHDRKPSNKFR